VSQLERDENVRQQLNEASEYAKLSLDCIKTGLLITYFIACERKHVSINPQNDPPPDCAKCVVRLNGRTPFLRATSRGENRRMELWFSPQWILGFQNSIGGDELVRLVKAVFSLPVS
jgi:hypothetical protein